MRSDWQDVLRGLHQTLEQTQWQPAEKTRALQENHLAMLVAHAYRTTPWYRDAWTAAGIDVNRFDPQRDWRRLPLLRRQDIQRGKQAFHSSDPPAEHGESHVLGTGGSTGEPVRVLASDWTQFWFMVLTLREHLWHGRDFSQTLGVIRYSSDSSWDPPEGQTTGQWGPATSIIGPTGPAAVVNVLADTDAQLDWLRRRSPGYLLTYPSVLHALAQRMLDRGLTCPSLLQARSMGEVLEPSVRAICREAWGIDIADVYSSEEVGCIAIQCPTGEHYHVQSENVYVEVLDDDDQPCGPGEVGRVVVTALHNYVMPLIRYELGDYAEVGEACKCGRTLPVINRVMGRQRNMFILPSGGKLWPSFVAAEGDMPLPPRQFQAVQRAIDQVEIRLVVDAPFSQAQQDQLIEQFRRGMGDEFRYSVVYMDRIPRSPRGKYEDFLCEVSD